MDNLALEGRPELASQVVRASPQQPRQLGGVVVDQSTGDGATGRVAQVHGITVAELTLDTKDPRR